MRSGGGSSTAAGAGCDGVRDSSASGRRIFSDSTLVSPRQTPFDLAQDFITRARPNKPVFQVRLSLGGVRANSGPSPRVECRQNFRSNVVLARRAFVGGLVNESPRVGFRIAHNRTTIPAIPTGGNRTRGIAAMAGLRDRPLMRDALLAGGVIAAGVVAALIALDPGAVPRPRFGFAAPVSERSGSAASASGSVKSHATTHARHAVTDAGALPKQIGFGPPSKKTKTSDATMVMLVPDLPRDNSEPPFGVWNDQGSAAPVSGNNSQPPPAIAMSAVGGISP